MTQVTPDIDEEMIEVTLIKRAAAIGAKNAKDTLSFEAEDAVSSRLRRSPATASKKLDFRNGSTHGKDLLVARDAKITAGGDAAFWSGLVNMTAPRKTVLLSTSGSVKLQVSSR